MRHRVNKTGLRKTKCKYKSLRKNLLTSFFKHEAIKTTQKRAAILSPLAQKVITIALTKEPREAIRQINNYVTEKEVAKKIMSEIKEKYQGRKSGFVSTYKLGFRSGDGASEVLIKLN
ncbi:50S ribosomal protein L17 [bacterium]|jgi:large subunit ribosomal protein L17|nr:50S ribosomal protein L17 [bacterium]